LGFGATCVAGLPGSGVEFLATALSTYPSTKIAATDNDLIRLLRGMVTAKPTAMTAVTICGSDLLINTELQDFDDGAESKARHLLGADVVAGETRNRLHRVGTWAQPHIASLLASLLGGVGLRQRD
jgi:hypothetical protein